MRLARDFGQLISVRTRAGLAASRAGRTGGRRPKLTARQIETARKMLDSGELTVTSIAELQGVVRFTVSRLQESKSNAV